MYSNYNIQKTLQRIYNQKMDIENERRKFKNKISDLDSWWRGQAGSAFKEGYLEIESETKRLISIADSLEDNLRMIPSAIQRADDERRAAKKMFEKNYTHTNKR